MKLYFIILVISIICIIIINRKFIKTFFKQLLCNHNWKKPYISSKDDVFFMRYCNKCHKKQISLDGKQWTTIK